MTRVQTSRVGVVVRALNEEAHIGKLLTGIGRQTVQPDKVVLVDSGSTDATVEIAERFGVEVVHIPAEHFSFGRSLNYGIEACNTEVVVLASAHVYPVYDSWIEHLVEPLWNNPNAALSYGRQVGDARTKFSERQLMARWFPEQSDHRQSHPFANNANAAISRAVWKAFPYDEDLTGLEDLDWARRTLEAGRDLAYVAEAPVVHVHEESWDRLRNRYRREAIAHRRIFREQRLALSEAVLLGVRNSVADYISAARERSLVNNLVSIPSFHAAQFIGAYQGFSQEGDVPEQLKRRFYFPSDGGTESLEASDIGQPIDYSAGDESHAPH